MNEKLLSRILSIEEALLGQNKQSTLRLLQRNKAKWMMSNPLSEREDVRFVQLRQFFFDYLGMQGDWQHYYRSDSLLPSIAFKARAGNGLALMLLLQHYAVRFDLQCQLIAFPEQAIVRFLIDGQTRYIDCFSGLERNEAQLALLLRGSQGNLARLSEAHLRPLSSAETTLRWLSELKLAYLHESDFERALVVTQGLLQLKPNDPMQLRDRGFIYQQLDCNHVAVKDFEYFIEQCPNDPLAKLLRVQVNALDNYPTILH